MTVLSLLALIVGTQRCDLCKLLINFSRYIQF